MRSTSRWWWGASILVHAALFAGGIAARTVTESTPTLRVSRPVEFEVVNEGRHVATRTADIAPTSERSALEPSAPQREAISQPSPGGSPRSQQNVSSTERGERGDGRSLERGQLLASIADGVNLSAYVMNALGITQEARVRTSSESSSFQQRNAMQSPGFDATRGTAAHAIELQIASSRTIAATGRFQLRTAPSVSRDPTPERATIPDTFGRVAPPPRAGSRAAAGGGLSRPSTGTQNTARSPIMLSSPAIQDGRTSNPSPIAAAEHRDNSNAVLLAASMLQQSLNASVHDGPLRGEGIGGVGGGGQAGSGGGHTSGGAANPSNGLANGSGPATDARFQRYLQTVRRRIDALWSDAFPHDEMLRFHQGRVIITFVIEANGDVTTASFRRRSGIEPFDRNVLAAVTTARLPPIPTELDRSRLQIDMAFHFDNAMVR